MLVRSTLVVTLLLSSLVIDLANACSCVPNRPPLSQTFASTSAVFIGTAINVTVDATKRERRVIFQATEVFKGSKCNRKKFTVFTNLDSAMCGLGISQGSRWQIWAQGSADRLTAYLCSESTTSINKNIDFLREQRSA